jgi:hypothetical protein
MYKGIIDVDIDGANRKILSAFRAMCQFSLQISSVKLSYILWCVNQIKSQKLCPTLSSLLIKKTYDLFLVCVYYFIYYIYIE